MGKWFIINMKFWDSIDKGFHRCFQKAFSEWEKDASIWMKGYGND